MRLLLPLLLVSAVVQAQSVTPESLDAALKADANSEGFRALSGVYAKFLHDEAQETLASNLRDQIDQISKRLAAIDARGGEINALLNSKEIAFTEDQLSQRRSEILGEIKVVVDRLAFYQKLKVYLETGDSGRAGLTIEEVENLPPPGALHDEARSLVQQAFALQDKLVHPSRITSEERAHYNDLYGQEFSKLTADAKLLREQLAVLATALASAKAEKPWLSDADRALVASKRQQIEAALRRS